MEQHLIQYLDQGIDWYFTSPLWIQITTGVLLFAFVNRICTFFLFPVYKAIRLVFRVLGIPVKITRRVISLLTSKNPKKTSYKGPFYLPSVARDVVTGSVLTSKKMEEVVKDLSGKYGIQYVECLTDTNECVALNKFIRSYSPMISTTRKQADIARCRLLERARILDIAALNLKRHKDHQDLEKEESGKIYWTGQRVVGQSLTIDDSTSSINKSPIPDKIQDKVNINEVI